MAFTRTAISAFDLANPFYVGATVTFFTVDSAGAKTTTLATLYAGVTGTTVLTNPQVLDSEGKFAQPVYIDEAVIATIKTNDTAKDHETGIVFANLAQNAVTEAQNASNFALAQASILEGAVSRVNRAAATLPGITSGQEGYFLRVKNDLSGRENISPDAAATAIGLSTFGKSLVDDNDAAAGRATLAAPGLSVANTFTKTQTWTKGADVASAATLTLGDGNYFDITGTTAITAIATKGVGTVVKLHFDAALTLTHNATDLVLPGGENITTAAGDEAEFVEYATGDWRCTNYQEAAAEQEPTYLVQGSALSGGSVATIGGGIPSWASRVTIMLSNASTNGTAIPEVRLGDSGGIETSGYTGTGAVIPSGTPPVTSANSSGFKISGSWAAAIQAAGSIVLDRVSSDGRAWVCSTTLGRTDGGANQTFTGGGTKTLSAALDRVALVTTNTFDGGSWSVKYE